MNRVLLAVAAVALALLAACTAPARTAQAPTRPFTTSVPVPASVSIPAIGASSTLVGLGLDASGALMVPPVDQPGQAAWFADGVRPGAVGPAVIYGHVNGRIDGASTPGVFARLDELAPGAAIDITRGDGTTATFTVTDLRRFGKDEFPTALVYRDTPDPELRLITCGGEYDADARSYRDNVVVFATLTGTR